MSAEPPKPQPEPASVDAPFAVVELFTSEGCDSCPPAETFLSELDFERANGARVFPLAFHVTYWNGTWVDRFSKQAFNARQRGYAIALDTGMYTPQLVINGTTQLVGTHRSEARDRVDEALARAAEVRVAATAKDEGGWHVAWTLDRPVPNAEVVAAIAERGFVVTPTSGENEGSTLRHDAVVRALATASADAKGTIVLEPPDDLVRENAVVVVFVQRAPQGAIVGATSLPLP